MHYYVSWTHSDPIYHAELEDISVLVSPPNVSRAWRVSDWPALPQRLIIDSGAFQYLRSARQPEPQAVLAQQLAMIAHATDALSAASIGLCHLDVPLRGTRNIAELDRRVERNLEQARWLMETCEATPLPAGVYPIGVIQGYTVERVYVVAQALADLGYTSFALGSLAGMVASGRDELLRRVEAALEAVGPDLHILGVSSPTILPELAKLGVRSVDSGAPIHEAWRGGLFYSRPFQRYKVASPHFTEWRRSYSFAEVLSEPLPCDCPVCQEDRARLLIVPGKQYVNLRALHNCYHLARELAAIAP